MRRTASTRESGSLDLQYHCFCTKRVPSVARSAGVITPNPVTKYSLKTVKNQYFQYNSCIYTYLNVLFRRKCSYCKTEQLKMWVLRIPRTTAHTWTPECQQIHIAVWPEDKLNIVREENGPGNVAAIWSDEAPSEVQVNHSSYGFIHKNKFFVGERWPYSR